MKTNFNYLVYSLAAVLVLSVSSCKKDNNPFVPEETKPAVSGVYILNEGDWNGDNASLSLFDFETGKVRNNVFYEANSQTVLGELANDIGIYGSKLYITVTGSNKMEILNTKDGTILKTISINEPRYIAFYGDYAFISSYTNRVFVVDTVSMAIHKEIEVGRTPEQLAVLGDQVFVTNAGWKDAISGGKYDNRVSVIDAKNLVKIKDIEVANNIDRIHADDNGHLYVNATTIYNNVPPYEELHPSRLYIIDVKTSAVNPLEFGASLMAIKDQTAYLISGNYEAGKTKVLEMNTGTLAIKQVDLFDNENIVNFNGLAVDPDNGDLWVSGYNEYGSVGKIYRYHTEKTKVDAYTVGIFPKAFAFKR